MSKGHAISPFKGTRARRDARREKRRDNRKLRKNGPEKQYYGGSKDELADQRARAKESVQGSQDKYNAATGKLDAAGDTATGREADAERDSDQNRVNTRSSRGLYQNSIDNIKTTSRDAIATRDAGARSAVGTRNNAMNSAMRLRNNTLQANDLNKIAAQNIVENQRNAQNILGRNIGIQQRAAMGLATGGGEGGALALQSAIAGAGQGAADMAGASQLQQAQLASDTRNNAAIGQVARADSVASLNANDTMGTGTLNASTQQDTAHLDAGTKTAAALDQTQGQLGLLSADQAQQGITNNRQLNFMGQSIGAAGAGSAAALENQGQMLNNEQTINGTQLGVDINAAKNKYDAAVRNNGLNKMISTVFDPMDIRGSGNKGVV